MCSDKKDTTPKQNTKQEVQTMNKNIKTINYKGIDFQIDGMDIYHNGKLLKPILNEKLNRYYIHVYLGKDKKWERYFNKYGYAYI